MLWEATNVQNALKATPNTTTITNVRTKMSASKELVEMRLVRIYWEATNASVQTVTSLTVFSSFVFKLAVLQLIIVSKKSMFMQFRK